MGSKELFSQALGDTLPWEITEINFKKASSAESDEAGELELHLTLDFARGSEFSDAEGEACKAYDTKWYTWRHLNFFQFKTLLHARVPRIIRPDGSISTITVPWGRRNGGFTMLFERFVLELIRAEMTPSAVAKLVGESPKRIWDMFNTIVEREGLPNNDDSGITEVGFDEKAWQKGHTYITIAVDMEKKRVFKIVQGRDSDAVKEVAEHMKAKGSPPEKVTDVSIDMSKAYIKGAREYFKAAEVSFDRFHVMKVVNKALDKVRALERKEFDALKGHKYTVLKNPESLSEKKLKELVDMLKLYPTIGIVYMLKELFRELWLFEDRDSAKTFLHDWYRLVEKSGSFPMQKAMKTIKNHEEGILRSVESRLTNALLEGMNSKIQLAIARARGYKNIRYIKNMIYFLCGDLKFNYPYVFS